MLEQDTIFGLATPVGYSALALIRLSGPDAFTKLQNVFIFENSKQSWKSIQSHKQYFGKVQDEKGIIDEAMCSVYMAPYSYTKENAAEISVHGSPYIVQRLSIALIHAGIRQAQPGEFTMRAFMNGRFDLSQAEAVADIIYSHSDASHQLAIKQFRGDFSRKITRLRKELIDFAALIELELDFSEEDVEFADRDKLIALLEVIIDEVKELRLSFAQGNVIKQGIPVCIVGRPNSGKSSLLNVLLKDDKAIVSDIPGTTRDALEDMITIDGVSFRFIDTAGLRQTDDVVENMGIERTLQMIEKAEIVLYVADLSCITSNEIIDDIQVLSETIEDFSKKKCIVIGNKIDLMLDIPHGFQRFFQSDTVFISAKRHENIEMLEDVLKNTVRQTNIQDGFLVSNTRHYDALIHTEQAISRVKSGVEDGISGDLLSSDLRDALYHLGSITGEISNDEILNSVFSNFCIGK